jgi:hypothetical protein
MTPILRTIIGYHLTRLFFAWGVYHPFAARTPGCYHPACRTRTGFLWTTCGDCTAEVLFCVHAVSFIKVWIESGEVQTRSGRSPVGPSSSDSGPLTTGDSDTTPSGGREMGFRHRRRGMPCTGNHPCSLACRRRGFFSATGGHSIVSLKGHRGEDNLVFVSKTRGRVFPCPIIPLGLRRCQEHPEFSLASGEVRDCTY